jgi:hypothetical protein
MFGRGDPYFDNISVDLIYGVPGMSNEKWKQNIKTFLLVPHISVMLDGGAKSFEEINDGKNSRAK